MTDTYNGWSNWATWNTVLHGNFETKEQVDIAREQIEIFESSVDNSYIQSMTYFSEINWDEIYESVKSRSTE